VRRLGGRTLTGEGRRLAFADEVDAEHERSDAVEAEQDALLAVLARKCLIDSTDKQGRDPFHPPNGDTDDPEPEPARRR
jgi:hypothetical protein